MRYRKVGGLHFVTVGRLGFSFHVKRKPFDQAAVFRACRRAAREYRRPVPREVTMGPIEKMAWTAGFAVCAVMLVLGH
jgi:hypothetical protein